MKKMRLDMIARVIGGEVVAGNPARMISGVTTDSRAVKPGQIFFALKGDKFDGHKFVKKALQNGASAAVVNENFGLRPDKQFGIIRVKDSLFALGELARYDRARRNIKTLGITGSVGKTTTKEMAALVLASRYKVAKSPGNFNNLVGVPLAIFGVAPKAEIAVLELASNQPGEIARLSEIAQPNAGIIVRIAQAHLEGFKSLEGVEAEKRALISSLGPEGIFIFNLDDPRLCRLALGYAGRKIGFGFMAPQFYGGELQVRAGKIKVVSNRSGLGMRFGVRVSGRQNQSAQVELKAVGGHLVENALAAIAAGLAMGIKLEEAAEALADFQLMRGRGRIEKSKTGVWIIDESYNANPESMRQALKIFSEYAKVIKGRKILVLGEMAELGDQSRKLHEELGRFLRKVAFNQLYYLGGFEKELGSGLGAGLRGKLRTAASLARLDKYLESELKPGDLVMVKSSHATGLWKTANRLRER